MKRAYVLRRNGIKNTFCLDMAKPQEALYCAILGEGEVNEFFYSEYADLQNVIDELMDTLTNREIKVLLYRFGFLGKYYSLRDTGEKLGCSGELVRLVERKALRKLRHPSRGKRLRSRYPGHGKFFEQFERSIDYKKILFEEIEKYISGANYKFDFLDKIMRKKNIRFDFPLTGKYMQVSIDELELSVRAYNCLKRAGILTVGDLLNKTAEDMMRVRNLGRKDLENIIECLRKMNIEWVSLDDSRRTLSTQSKFVSMDFKKNNDCVKYKLNCKDRNELVECIYEIVLQECTEWSPIIDYNLSVGLINLLLLKGFFFVEDVIDEYEKILKEFSVSGFDSYEDELKSFVHAIKKYMVDVTHPTTKIIWLSKDVAKKIISQNPNRYSDLFPCFVTDDEDLNAKYKEILHEHLLLSNFAVKIEPLEDQTDRYSKYFVEETDWEDIQVNSEEIDFDEDILEDEWETLE